ncbi:MAG: helix-turn-helix transcriptional regulator, partial [Oscillospiraceae bacterium]
NKDGDKIKYSIYAAPIVIKGSVERVLIFISPVQESVKKYQELKAKLTPREIEILTFVADGFTNRYIAKKLNISEGTVKRTIYNAYKKLEIGSRVELVRIFFNL